MGTKHCYVVVVTNAQNHACFSAAQRPRNPNWNSCLCAPASSATIIRIVVIKKQPIWPHGICVHLSVHLFSCHLKEWQYSPVSSCTQSRDRNVKGAEHHDTNAHGALIHGDKTDNSHKAVSVEIWLNTEEESFRRWVSIYRSIFNNIHHLLSGCGKGLRLAWIQEQTWPVESSCRVRAGRQCSSRARDTAARQNLGAQCKQRAV